jgi:hypothetical protein
LAAASVEVLYQLHLVVAMEAAESAKARLQLDLVAAAVAVPAGDLWHLELVVAAFLPQLAAAVLAADV